MKKSLCTILLSLAICLLMMPIMVHEVKADDNPLNVHYNAESGRIEWDRVAGSRVECTVSYDVKNPTYNTAGTHPSTPGSSFATQSSIILDEGAYTMPIGRLANMYGKMADPQNAGVYFSELSGEARVRGYFKARVKCTQRDKYGNETETNSVALFWADWSSNQYPAALTNPVIEISGGEHYLYWDPIKNASYINYEITGQTKAGSSQVTLVRGTVLTGQNYLSLEHLIEKANENSQGWNYFTFKYSYMSTDGAFKVSSSDGFRIYPSDIQNGSTNFRWTDSEEGFVVKWDKSYDQAAFLSSANKNQAEVRLYREDRDSAVATKTVSLTNGVLSPGSVDFTADVARGGDGKYYAAICLLDKNNSAQLLSKLAETYPRNYYAPDYFYFTEQSPENGDTVAINTANGYVDVSYKAYLISWLKNKNILAVPTAITVTNNSSGAQSTVNFSSGSSDAKRTARVSFASAGKYTISYTVNQCVGTTHYRSMPTLTCSFTVEVSAAPQQLKAPEPVMDFTGSVSWPAVSGASGYDLVLKDNKLNEIVSVNTEQTSYVLPDTSILKEKGVYRWYVTAYDSRGQYRRSEQGRTEWTTHYSGEWLHIYIGSVPVTTANRYDVLGDGGSVQFLPSGKTYNENLTGETLVLNNLKLGDAAYHTSTDGHRSKIYIDGDIHVFLIGENVVADTAWEDDQGGLDGIYAAPNNAVSFYGDGSLKAYVSNNGVSALYAPGTNITLNDNVSVDLSGHYGFYSDYSDGNLGGLTLLGQARLSVYGEANNDYSAKGYAVISPEIVVNDKAYFYAQNKDGDEAVNTWGDIYTYNAQTKLTIRAIRIGASGPAWEELDGINEDSSNHESLFKILEIEAGPKGSGGGESGDFELTRLFGDDRFRTAAEIGAEVVARNGGSVNTVVFANAYNFPDALTGSVLAAQRHAPILLVGSDPASNQIATFFVMNYMGSSGKVILLGGQAAVPNQVADQLRSIGFEGEILRLEGQDRYETNIKIVQEMNVPSGTDVIVASGSGFADSLAVSGFAGADGIPIFLASTPMDQGILDEIRKIGPGTIYIMGGNAAVSAGAEAELTQIAPVKRVAGATRFETCEAIAREFMAASTDTAVVANAYNFPDALAGSVLASHYRAPIILAGTDQEVLTAQKQFLAGSQIRHLIVAGGQAAVPDASISVMTGE